MGTIKAIAALILKKVINKVKVLKGLKRRPISKVKVTGSRMLVPVVPTERSYHKEYSCEISKL